MSIYNLPSYDAEKCVLFALGRNAMFAACLAAGLKEGDEVLTPAYDCDGAIQPFRALNIARRYYSSDPYDFSANTDDISKKITGKTKMIHVINHFGMPQPWDKLLELKRSTGIPILEDNAYSLFSSFNGKPFGTMGDMAVFSLRKNLPVICGGMLRINNPEYAVPAAGKRGRWFHPTETIAMLSLIKTRLGWHKAPAALRRIARGVSPEIEPPPPLYSDQAPGVPEWPARDRIGEEFSCDHLRPISRMALMQIERFSGSYYDEVRKRKRSWYEFLSTRLRKVEGLTVLWPDLPPGTVPFCLSILVGSGRDILFKELRSKYDVMAWPMLPGEVIAGLKDHPEVELLGRKIIQINIAADKVMLKSFPSQMEGLVGDVISFMKNR